MTTILTFNCIQASTQIELKPYSKVVVLCCVYVDNEIENMRERTSETDGDIEIELEPTACQYLLLFRKCYWAESQATNRLPIISIAQDREFLTSYLLLCALHGNVNFKEQTNISVKLKCKHQTNQWINTLWISCQFKAA